MVKSQIPQPLRDNLVKLGAALAIGASGAGSAYLGSQPTYELGGEKVSHELAVAYEMGRYFESSYRHIGTPYVDRVGKGQPLTVCNGVTGPEVVAGRYYTPEACTRLELPKYLSAERAAKRLFTHWPTYNVWQRASFIDMIYNLGEQALVAKTITRKANAGDLIGACNEMPKWVYGTVKGQSTKLPGLVPRRGTTQELCAEWGRGEHFSMAHFDLLPVAEPVPSEPPIAEAPAKPAIALVAVVPAEDDARVLDTVNERQPSYWRLVAMLAAAGLMIIIFWRRKS